MFNMSAIGMCYDIKNLIFASFKGDDSVLLADSVKEAQHNTSTFINYTGYKIKAYKVNILEYIANIITPQGKFFPDVLRRVSRILSKIYSTTSDWQEQKLSIMDSLDVIENDDFEIGCQIAARFYQNFNININVEEVRTLAKYLIQLRDRDNIDDIPTKTYEIRSIILDDTLSTTF